jgi:hypothetical protein
MTQWTTPHKGIFEEGTMAVDGVLMGIQVDETLHQAWFDQQLIKLNSRLDLTFTSLQKQADSIQLLMGNVDNLLATTTKNAVVIEVHES